MAYFPRHLLVTAQTVDLDSCLLRISGIILIGESRYRTKRESHLISMAYCRRVGRKVNRQGPRTVKELLECMSRHLPTFYRVKHNVISLSTRRYNFKGVRHRN